MPAEHSPEVKFEIGHVLFIDIVDYSRLLINQQSEQLETLKKIVWATEQFRLAEAEGKLLRLPTGDGGALVFRNSPEAPVRCALEISKQLKNHPELRVRMGIHSGPVNEVTDLNEQANIAGAGINIAQRIMDCGDAGHILLSKHVAEDLEHYPRWQPYLHELGECEVKHGARVSIVNLYTDEAGNATLPARFRTAKKTSHPPRRLTAFRNGLLVIIALICLGIPALIFAPAILKMRQPATRAGAAAASSIPEKSIAVLPFENLSSDKENAFFADGVQDEILTDLAKVADLKVISRTSVMQYRNTAARNLREIAKQLGVAHVLEGSVQREANKIRVNAQLIDARNDAHLWAHTYDRDLADVFAIQSQIAETIAEQLQARLSPSEKAAIAQAPTKDVVANDLYVRALALNDRVNDPGGKESLLQAVSLLEEAVRRDPNFVLAHCLLCETHLSLYWAGFDHTPARRDQALAALQAAERIQPDSGDVHAEKGLYAYHGFRDYDRARVELELARKKLPNAANLYSSLGAVDRRQGRWDDAIRNYDRAVQLDPRNFLVVEEAAFTYSGIGRNAEVARLLKQAIELSPRDYFARIQLAEIPFLEQADLRPLREQLNAFLKEGPEATSNAAQFFVLCALADRDRAAAAQALTFIPPEGTVFNNTNFLMPRDWYVGLVARTFGDTNQAQSAFAAARAGAAKTVQEQPNYAPAWSLLGMIDAGLGHKADAIAEGKRACELLPISKDALEGPIYVTNLALIYAWVGEKDRAFEQLAISAKYPIAISYGELKLDPTWDPLRDDPRFEKLVASKAPKKSE
jgi:TolB-like protein/class 3 adenylate cyclase/Flp pilus assembly protein TadD